MKFWHNLYSSLQLLLLKFGISICRSLTIRNTLILDTSTTNSMPKIGWAFLFQVTLLFSLFVLVYDGQHTSPIDLVCFSIRFRKGVSVCRYSAICYKVGSQCEFWELLLVNKPLTIVAFKLQQVCVYICVHEEIFQVLI